MVSPSRQAAPRDLERVRELLNTWLIPNDTRLPSDRFADLARALRLRDRRDASRLRALRDDLRAAVEDGPGGLGRLDPWIARLKIRPVLTGEGPAVRFAHAGGKAGEYLAIVLRAIQEATWTRLKACPDCRWVFFDHTRNGTKRWCLMNARGPTGRACGTIDKVRRFRARQRDKR
ncbi:MAG TPA: CGNR zinc finger domain-containing protein [Candidatus Acidoferrum sp.]|nr:CGNR zinc finger domain-containing protein [Candidatus Acidoferrum sp.]